MSFSIKSKESGAAGRKRRRENEDMDKKEADNSKKVFTAFFQTAQPKAHSSGGHSSLIITEDHVEAVEQESETVIEFLPAVSAAADVLKNNDIGLIIF